MNTLAESIAQFVMKKERKFPALARGGKRPGECRTAFWWKIDYYLQDCTCFCEACFVA